MHPLDDTIAAIASPPGGAARGIVRISGPNAIECAGRFFQPDKGHSLSTWPFPCVISGRLVLPELHSPIPCDAYFWSHRSYTGQDSDGDGGRREKQSSNSAKPALPPSSVPLVRSYTGQPVVEIHTLGSPPLLEMILRTICSAGARLAAPGEFTLRAFLAGRIDLSQAEAVLGVIDAADPQDLKVALSQLAGGLARPLHRLRDDLLDLLAHLEAGFDFADEELPFLTREELDRRLAQAEDCVVSILSQMTSRGEPAGWTRVVFVGRPNAGKSSLFNALAGGRAALVSDCPGTTRDYLVAELDLDGVKCQLIDTAGAGEVPLPIFSDPIATAAQSASAEQRRGAHVRLLCLDSTRPLDPWERDELEMNSAEKRIVVLTKCDATSGIDWMGTCVRTSSVTGLGIETLRTELRRRVLDASGVQGDVLASTAARCRESIRLAGECLDRARNAAQSGQEELVAAEVRLALEELGTVVGAIYTEDILDRIFSRFCIGK